MNSPTEPNCLPGPEATRYYELTPDDTNYLKRIEELETQVSELALHPGYIAKAGPAEQQAMDLAAQLAKLQHDFQTVERENTELWEMLADFQREINAKSYHAAAARKEQRTAVGVRVSRGL